MNRKNIFFTSDWHIGHENVLKFCNRPFDDLVDMHKKIVKRFNATVTPNSVTYFLGDMGLCSQTVLKDVIDQLNGVKVLVLGNHDKKMHGMYNCGFDVVLYSADIYIHNERVTMSHCPLKGLYREDVSTMKNCDPTDNWHGETKKSNIPFMLSLIHI